LFTSGVFVGEQSDDRTIQKICNYPPNMSYYHQYLWIAGRATLAREDKQWLPLTKIK
jgi:hypothetical protein